MAAAATVELLNARSYTSGRSSNWEQVNGVSENTALCFTVREADTVQLSKQALRRRQRRALECRSESAYKSAKRFSTGHKCVIEFLIFL